MYDSPIEKIIGEMQSQTVKDEEGKLMAQVSQTIGYDIDKDELIKALNYDRQQYEKGYDDGLKASKWISCKERLPEEDEDVLVCSDTGNIDIISGYYSDIVIDYFVWCTNGWRFGDVVAWQPLPGLTKSELKCLREAMKNE